jgi:hypothetical protein
VAYFQCMISCLSPRSSPTGEREADREYDQLLILDLIEAGGRGRENWSMLNWRARGIFSVYDQLLIPEIQSNWRARGRSRV